MVNDEEDFIRRNFLTIKTMNQKQIYQQVVSNHHTLTPGELGSTGLWHHPGARGGLSPAPKVTGPWASRGGRRSGSRNPIAGEASLEPLERRSRGALKRTFKKHINLLITVTDISKLVSSSLVFQALYKH